MGKGRLGVPQTPTVHDRELSLFLHPARPRQKIFKERALPDIENYMFENHDQLRQAATECVCNMVLNKEVGPARGGVVRAGYCHVVKVAFLPENQEPLNLSWITVPSP